MLSCFCNKFRCKLPSKAAWPSYNRILALCDIVLHNESLLEHLTNGVEDFVMKNGNCEKVLLRFSYLLFRMMSFSEAF